ncbi:hypothetical protein KBC55_00890 [Patescibacteria group bacterium]|nr:hypothetical protein [Patescibacteria group bacterium]
MSEPSITTETTTHTSEVKNDQGGYNPLMIAGFLGVLMVILMIGVGYMSRTPAVGNQPTVVVAEETSDPGETPLAVTITPGPITVAVNDDVRLAPVTIKRQDHLCAIVTFEKDLIEGVDLTWPNKSSKERWEICGTDLKKEAADAHGAMVLTVGGKRIKLSEVITTTGDYTALVSTPGALARCWGAGQVNGDGQPACTPKPAAPANVVAQNAAAK